MCRNRGSHSHCSLFLVHCNCADFCDVRDDYCCAAVHGHALALHLDPFHFTSAILAFMRTQKASLCFYRATRERGGLLPKLSRIWKLADLSLQTLPFVNIEMLSALILLSLISSIAAFSAVGKSGSAKLSMNAEMSKSLPFLKKPKNLDGLIVCLFFYSLR